MKSAVNKSTRGINNVFLKENNSKISQKKEKEKNIYLAVNYKSFLFIDQLESNCTFKNYYSMERERKTIKRRCVYLFHPL